MRLLLLILILFPATLYAQAPKGPERFEESIQKFEQQIKDGTSKPGSILFVGSSSIRLWDLKKWFPEHECVNHGFGGSEMSDTLHFFDRIITPLKPSMILIYAGDNDIGKGKSAETVHADFKTLIARVKAELPGTRTGFIAIKPSISRWKLSEEMAKANNAIRMDCEADEQLLFVDIWRPMLGDDGRPRPELFADDGLHLNDEGYRLWTSIVARALPPAK